MEYCSKSIIHPLWLSLHVAYMVAVTRVLDQEKPSQKGRGAIRAPIRRAGRQHFCWARWRDVVEVGVVTEEEEEIAAQRFKASAKKINQNSADAIVSVQTGCRTYQLEQKPASDAALRHGTARHAVALCGATKEEVEEERLGQGQLRRRRMSGVEMAQWGLDTLQMRLLRDPNLSLAFLAIYNKS